MAGAIDFGDRRDLTFEPNVESNPALGLRRYRSLFHVHFRSWRLKFAAFTVQNLQFEAGYSAITCAAWRIFQTASSAIFIQREYPSKSWSYVTS